MELRKLERRDWPDDPSLPHSVRAPVRHQGVGDALRAAFLPRACKIPGDMMALLAQLG